MSGEAAGGNVVDPDSSAEDDSDDDQDQSKELQEVSAASSTCYSL